MSGGGGFTGEDGCWARRGSPGRAASPSPSLGDAERAPGQETTDCRPNAWLPAGFPRRGGFQHQPWSLQQGTDVLVALECALSRCGITARGESRLPVCTRVSFAGT